MSGKPKVHPEKHEEGSSHHSHHGHEDHKDHKHHEHHHGHAAADDDGQPHGEHKHKHHDGELSESADDLKKKKASKHSIHGGEHHHGHHHHDHDTPSTGLSPTPELPPEVSTELNKIPKMKEFLAGHVSIAEQFKKHPEIAATVAKDPNLAKRIMDNPLFLQQMIDTKSANLSDPSTQQLSSKPSGDVQKGNQPSATLVGTANATTTTTTLTPRRSILKVSTPVMGGVKPAAPLAVNEKPVRKIPSSIKYLEATDRIFLAHHVEIKHGSGKPLYRAFEGKVSNNITVREMDGSEIIVLQKHITIFKKTLDIYCPPGSFAGKVKVVSGPGLETTYHIKDEDKITEIIVRPKKCYKLKKYRSVFEMIHLTETGKINIGEIKGEWPDLPEGFPSNLIYGVNFPIELTPDLKIGVLGAWFLIYKLFYEGSLKKDKVLEKDRRSLDLVGVKKTSNGNANAIPGANNNPPKRESFALADMSKRNSHKMHSYD